MKEKELCRQLKNLGKLKTSQAWLKSQRDLLSMQITNSGARDLSLQESFRIKLQTITNVFLKPSFAIASFVLAFLALSYYSHLAFTSVRPDETLYIARLISEKARLSTVNRPNRVKLETKFAIGHSETIMAALDKESQVERVSGDEKIAFLNESLDRELKEVRENIDRLKKEEGTTKIQSNETALNKNQSQSLTNNNINSNLNYPNNPNYSSTQNPSSFLSEEDLILSAGGLKDNSGLQIDIKKEDGLVSSDNKKEEGEEEDLDTLKEDELEEDLPKKDQDLSEEEKQDLEDDIYSSLEALDLSAKSSELDLGEIDRAMLILGEVEHLAGEGDYTKALDKFREFKWEMKKLLD